MPQAFDNAWSSIGGGPADLSFPDTFLGVWLTESTLTKVETPARSGICSQSPERAESPQGGFEEQDKI